ncbi:PqqD family protein [Actinacidiphila paucisporea]|uniref:PqqD family protein n=1 Tax=Actinacidiphila paucisporea TaxID=310782 RepID=A0A1M7FVR3_9ACTN|nr:PqqD family protein [Actinacidiphila paucisporea]SHM07729.1 hypothetical protein SAMN05216499_10861 [Actinacidiphila paucisporea]
MSGPTLAVHQLSFVPEGDDVLVGRVETGSYAVFPADGAELLRQLAAGLPLEQAARWYEEAFDEPVDVEDFVDTLQELGFLKEHGGDEPSAEPAAPAPVRHQALGRALFGTPAWILYALSFTAWAVVCVRHPDLLPHPSQIFFVKSLLIVQAVITFGQIPLILAHEGYHVLAGRRLGLPSSLRLSNRLTYIVAETQLNGLMSVPRRRRYLPFLSGMVCDAVVFALLGLAAQLARQPGGDLSVTSRVCLALAFTVALRFAWQFQLYLRTDLFYVLATAMKCHDLHDASKAVMRNRLWRLLRMPHRTVDLSRWTDRDRKVGGYYGPFLVIGVCAFIGLTLFASIPVGIRYFTVAGEAIGARKIDAHFWDSVLSLGFNIAQVVTLIVLARGKRRQGAPRQPAPSER